MAKVFDIVVADGRHYFVEALDEKAARALFAENYPDLPIIHVMSNSHRRSNRYPGA